MKRRKPLRGFTLPMTLALAFGIMSVAAALTATVTVRAKAARQRDAEVFALVTLESAVQAGLIGLEKDGAPDTPAWDAAQALNGRTVRLTWQAVRYKIDVGQDDPALIAAAVAEPRLRAAALAATVVADTPGERAAFGRLIDYLKVAAPAAGDEDCLRTLVTLGRQAPQASPPPPETALRPEMVPLTAGDVVEVRAELRSDVGREVLWQRLRYTGAPGRPWRIHDWRRLRLPPGETTCRPAR